MGDGQGKKLDVGGGLIVMGTAMARLFALGSITKDRAGMHRP